MKWNYMGVSKNGGTTPFHTPKWSFLDPENPMGLLGKPTLLGNSNIEALHLGKFRNILRLILKNQILFFLSTESRFKPFIPLNPFFWDWIFVPEFFRDLKNPLEFEPLLFTEANQRPGGEKRRWTTRPQCTLENPWDESGIFNCMNRWFLW